MYSSLFYQVFEQYTDQELFINLANKLHDEEKVVIYSINIGDFQNAINLLKKLVNIQYA